MEVQFYRRTDGKWAWRLIAGNGNVVATDGGQGYERRVDAEKMFANIQHVMFHGQVEGFGET